MKKLICILLSVMMVFNVVAFGVTLEELPEEEKKLLELPELTLNDGVSVFTTGKGGTFYVILDIEKDYKNIVVADKGIVKAEKFNYDPEKHVPIAGVEYCVKIGDTVVANGLDYEDALITAKGFNDTEKTTQYKIALDNCYVNIIKIIVDDNYKTSYEEGEVVISATLDKEVVSAKIKVVNDVFVYDVENVKYASQNELVLDDTYKGTSSFNEIDVDAPTVIPKSAFRSLVGKDLAVENGGVVLEIKDIDSAQSALNVKAFMDIDEEEKTIEFGFFGNKQKVYSEFVIKPEIDMTYYELREFFGIKLEEKDIVEYTLYKDGKPITQITVDYMKVDYDRKVELEIFGENETLGVYCITAEFYDAEAEGDEVVEEENPNTGAPVFTS